MAAFQVVPQTGFVYLRRVALVKADDPQEGIESVGLNQDILVKATLVDDRGRPLPGERIMFAYNTEWNLAKSAATDKSGVAFCTIRTSRRSPSRGLGGECLTIRASATSR